MKNWRYDETKTKVVVDAPSTKKLKITGTRFATILGFNAWQGSFTAWCEITKLGKLPFTESIYTNAGKIIEPKIHAYLKEKMGLNNLKTPEEYFGARYKEVKYDFFSDTPIFGGMWDALVTKNDGITPRLCVEYKTTKRAEDWEISPPLYYLAQACLYPYLLGIDDFMLTVTFLKDNDYNDPSKFEVTDENTRIYTYKVSEVKFPLNGQLYSFEELVQSAREWWDYYAKGTESPPFDEKKDRDMLALLRTHKPSNDNGFETLADKYELLSTTSEYVDAKVIVDAYDAELKSIKDAMKSQLIEIIEKDTELEVIEQRGWTLSKTKPQIKADIDALVKDGRTEYLFQTNGTYTIRPPK